MRIFFVLVTVSAVLLVLAMLIGSFGRVEGSEFHPDTFSRRSYHYYELPLIHVQITPVRRRPDPGDLSLLLANNGWLKGPPRAQRWDLVYCLRNASPWQRGDASILCQYLDTLDADGEVFWTKWTKNHPAAAPILWPEIARLARKELYFLVPDLLAVATRDTDAKQLRRDLNRTLARKYEQLAKVEATLNHFRSAADLYTQALVYEPQRSSSLIGRASADRKLGKSDRAEADPDLPAPTKPATPDQP